jgi:hypothetical protein
VAASVVVVSWSDRRADQTSDPTLFDPLPGCENPGGPLALAASSRDAASRLDFLNLISVFALLCQHPMPFERF